MRQWGLRHALHITVILLEFSRVEYEDGLDAFVR